MDLLTTLKHATHDQHKQTEIALYADRIMQGELTLDAYKHLLLIHYLFHQALEEAVTGQPGFFADYDLDNRRKTPWLLADLQQANVPVPPPQPDLFVNWTGRQLLGALYVAEGSTLGGRVINRAIAQTPGLQPVSSRFFGGYGEDTGPYWKAFGTYLTHRTDGHPDEVVAAAAAAFGLFQHIASNFTVAC